MGSLLKAIAECLFGRDPEYVSVNRQTTFTDDKARLREQDIAAEVVNLLLTADKKGRELEAKVQDIVGEYGWTENIAEAILNGIVEAVEKCVKMGNAMTEASEKAKAAAKDFVQDHPYIVCTIIAIGILVLLAPWVIEAVGFGEFGPIAGSWAARWQATYGNVPKGALFTFFQRLGMVWRRVPKGGSVAV